MPGQKRGNPSSGTRIEVNQRHSDSVPNFSGHTPPWPETLNGSRPTSMELGALSWNAIHFLSCFAKYRMQFRYSRSLTPSGAPATGTRETGPREGVLPLSPRNLAVSFLCQIGPVERTALSRLLFRLLQQPVNPPPNTNVRPIRPKCIRRLTTKTEFSQTRPHTFLPEMVNPPKLSFRKPHVSQLIQPQFRFRPAPLIRHWTLLKKSPRIRPPNCTNSP